MAESSGLPELGSLIMIDEEEERTEMGLGRGREA